MSRYLTSSQPSPSPRSPHDDLGRFDDGPQFMYACAIHACACTHTLTMGAAPLPPTRRCLPMCVCMCACARVSTSFAPIPSYTQPPTPYILHPTPYLQPPASNLLPNPPPHTQSSRATHATYTAHADIDNAAAHAAVDVTPCGGLGGCECEGTATRTPTLTLTAPLLPPPPSAV